MQERDGSFHLKPKMGFHIKLWKFCPPNSYQGLHRRLVNKVFPFVNSSCSNLQAVVLQFSLHDKTENVWRKQHVFSIFSKKWIAIVFTRGFHFLPEIQDLLCKHWFLPRIQMVSKMILVGENYNTKTLQPALKTHNIIIQRLKMGKRIFFGS